MASYLTAFLLFALPLIVVPFWFLPYEAPKVILGEILIEVLLLINILRSAGWRREATIKTIIKWWPFAGLFILSLAHIIFFRTSTTFFGNPFRLQGVFLLWHLIAFSLISSYIKMDQIPKFFYPLSLLGLLLETLIMGGNEAGRAVGTLGEPNALAAAAIFIWPFASLVIPAPARGWSAFGGKAEIHFKTLSRLIAPLLAFAIIFLSGSRSGLLAFGIQLIFLSLITYRSTAVARYVILCLILIVFSLAFPLFEGGGWFENRSEVWSTALQAGLQHPIFGSGFGNIEYALKNTSKLINNNIQYQYVDSSHNFLLDYFVQGGMLGVGFIISILYLSLLRLTQKRNRLLLCSFLGVLTVMSFNPVSVVTLLAFWFLIGQGFQAVKPI